MDKTAKRFTITGVYLVIIIALTVIMNIYVTSNTRNNNIERMKALARERSVIITDYTKNAEFALSAYSTSNEIKDLLADPSNPEKIALAQEYTDKISGMVKGVEGIYVSQWNTTVLAHTDTQYVGMTTRTGASLEKLRKSLLDSGNNVYNTGIIISPSSGKQILSLYKAIYDDSGNPIGVAGLGVYMEDIENSFRKLQLNTENSVFSMVNVSDGKYILCEDTGQTGIQVNNPTALELCEELRDSGKGDSVYEYEKDGKVSLYAYVSDYDWLIMIDSPKGEVYKNSRIINIYMAVFSIFVIVWTVIFNIMLSKQEKTEQKLEKSKRKQETIKSNLHTVALRDILTDVNNRIKFIDDFGRDKNGRYKIQDCPDNPYFFVMFNIAKFSNINIKYGHDSGDAVLVTTADILKNYFSDPDIYRTGSDEFVVAVQCPKENVNNFIKKLNVILKELNKPLKSGSDFINVDYSVSAVKKSSTISPAVLLSLKDIINNNGITKENVIFVDMD